MRTQFTLLTTIAAAATLVLTGCGKSGDNASTGGGSGSAKKVEIRVKGSDTLVQLATAWAEAYRKVKPNVYVNVNGGGTGTGIAALQNNSTDICNASREMKAEERTKVKEVTGKDVQEFTCAYDALAVYVNPGNPTKEISIEELREIWAEGGTMENWEQIDPALKGKFALFGRQNNSGTYDYFREHICGKTADGKQREFRGGISEMNGSAEVVENVAKTPTGLGYSGMGYKTPTVHWLKVSAKKGEPGVEPGIEVARSGKYPISRKLYMYTAGEPAPEVKAYIEWCVGPEGQKIVEKEGFVSLKLTTLTLPMKTASTVRSLPGSLASERSTPVPEPAPAQGRRKFRLLDALEKPIEVLIRLCGWSSIIGIAAIFLFIFKEAAPMVPKLDWVHFFTSPRWIPNPAPGNAASFGALALIAGTFATTFIALIIAVPVGLGAAVYVSEFARGKVKETLKIVIELLAAIPSIVWGFIGLMVLGPFLKAIFTAAPGSWWGHIMVTLHLASAETGAAQGTNLLTGGVILALMSVPVIVSLSEDALRAVPDSFREAALALGANPWETVRRVLFPAARNGLLAACLLGMGRAIGETMAVLLATGHNLRIPHALTDPVRTMTATIAAEMGETVHGGDHYRVLFILGIVLFIMTCSINVASDLIIKGVKKANKA